MTAAMVVSIRVALTTQKHLYQLRIAHDRLQQEIVERGKIESFLERVFHSWMRRGCWRNGTPPIGWGNSVMTGGARVWTE